MSSHGLLLRLFLSQGFFSVLRALQYTRTYSDNIGITHYLCSRLDAVPADELADKWLLVWCVNGSLCCNLLLSYSQEVICLSQLHRLNPPLLSLSFLRRHNNLPISLSRFGHPLVWPNVSTLIITM